MRFRSGILAVTVFVVATLCGHSSRAHTLPERRTIVAQAEENEVVILVSWNSSTNFAANGFLAQAIVGRRGAQANKSLRSHLTAKALQRLRITLDDAPLPIESFEVKVILDSNTAGRVGAAILLVARIPAGRHQVVIFDAQNSPNTRLTWTDKSAGRARAPSEPAKWLHEPLRITWNDSQTLPHTH